MKKIFLLTFLAVSIYQTNKPSSIIEYQYRDIQSLSFQNTLDKKIKKITKTRKTKEKQTTKIKYPYDLVEQIIQERIPLFVAEHLNETQFDRHVINKEEIHEYLKYYHSKTSEQDKSVLTHRVSLALQIQWDIRNKVMGVINELVHRVYQGRELVDIREYIEEDNYFIDYIISKFLEKEDYYSKDNIESKAIFISDLKDRDYVEAIESYFDEHGY